MALFEQRNMSNDFSKLCSRSYNNINIYIYIYIYIYGCSRYGHLPPITKTIQVRRTRHAGHCWRSRDELISDVLLWTPTYGRAKAGRLARTYIQQLCENTGCSPEDLPEAMNDREKWRERVRDMRATSRTWWWWWWWYMGEFILKRLEIMLTHKNIFLRNTKAKIWRRYFKENIWNNLLLLKEP